MSDASLDFAIPDEMPVLPLREFVIFPYMVLPLFVSRERSIAAIEDALAGDRLLLLTAQRNPELDEPEPDDLHQVGTVAMVMRVLRLPDGRVKVLTQGLAKARIESFVENEPAAWAQVSAIEADPDGDWSVEGEALMRTVRQRVEELLPLKNLPPEILSITQNAFEPGRLADLVASNLRLRIGEAQEVLEVIDPISRLRKVDNAAASRARSHDDAGRDPDPRPRKRSARGQRENYLREQLRAIQVGARRGGSSHGGDRRVPLEDRRCPACRRSPYDETVRQLRRLERMHPDGPEARSSAATSSG